MPWGLAATAVLGLAGSAMQADAASSAADTQAQAAKNAQQISQQEFNTITAQEQPFLQSGYGAQSQLNYLLGIGTPGQTGQGGGIQGYDPSSGYRIGAGGSITSLIPGGFGSLGTGFGNPPMMTATQGMTTGGQYTGPTVASSSPAGGFGSLLTPFTADYMKQYSPAYQFQLQQGQQGVLNGNAAGQGALSGAALKDLISYNQNYANTAFGNAFNQYQTQQGNIYSRLAGVAQLGQAAAANTGQQGTALAGQAAQSAQNIGTAQAAGQVGAANAWANGLSNMATPWLLAGSGYLNG